MSDEDTYQIRDYREGTDSKTPCPRCGALIVLNATTCLECGAHFRGRAVDFSPASMAYKSGDRPITCPLLVLESLACASG